MTLNTDGRLRPDRYDLPWVRPGTEIVTERVTEARLGPSKNEAAFPLPRKLIYPLIEDLDRSISISKARLVNVIRSEGVLSETFRIINHDPESHAVD